MSVFSHDIASRDGIAGREGSLSWKSISSNLSRHQYSVPERMYENRVNPGHSVAS